MIQIFSSIWGWPGSQASAVAARLTGDARALLTLWVYEGAEVRLTGGYAEGSGLEGTPSEAGFASPELGSPVTPSRAKIAQMTGDSIASA